jgi:hypothetical protein
LRPNTVQLVASAGAIVYRGEGGIVRITAAFMRSVVLRAALGLPVVALCSTAVGFTAVGLPSVAWAQPAPPPADEAEPPAKPKPAEPDKPKAGEGAKAGSDDGNKRPEWGLSGREDGDTVSPWEKDGPKPKVEGEGGEVKGSSQVSDTVSPWAKGERGSAPAGKEVRDTVSPWDLDTAGVSANRERVPAEVDARVDVRMGDSTARWPRDPQVRGGIYDRPYLLRVGTDGTAVAVGGYAHMLGDYEVLANSSDGFSFEARSLHLFIASRIADRVRFSAELGFDHGGQDIGVELAAADIMLHEAFNIRGGIILSPIGKFNLAHDAPRYNIVDRPLVSTQIIPSTLSEAGMGVFGALSLGSGNRLTYELYAVSGLGDGIIASEGTRIAEGRHDNRFAADNNGSPAAVGRIALLLPRSERATAELGMSFYGGVYNTFANEDQLRWMNIGAVDADLTIGPLNVRGEVAYANIDLRSGLADIYGSDQFGFYAETTLTLYDNAWWVFERSQVQLTARGEFVDLNLNHRAAERAGDETWRLSVGPAFRPAPETSLRVVYHHDWIADSANRDLRGWGLQFGIATYF